ncbi:MAG: hypothetical protein MJZ00_05175 [Paludibacteraceae bacterium]|nr:hypothetical protein [Paludibacteraceae bacterium]
MSLEYNIWLLDKARKGISEIFRLVAKTISELCKNYDNETIFTYYDECSTIYAYVCCGDSVAEQAVKAIKSNGEGLWVYIDDEFSKFNEDNVDWNDNDHVFPLWGSDLMGVYTLYNIIQHIDEYAETSDNSIASL